MEQLIDAVLRLVAAGGLVGQVAFRVRQNRLDGQQFAFQFGQARPRPVGANQEEVQVQILQFGGQLQIHAGVAALFFQWSVVLLEQLRTIDKQRLREKVCHLEEDMIRQIDEALRVSLDITRT